MRIVGPTWNLDFTDAKLEKGLRGFRQIALLSVFSKYTTILVDLLHEEKQPTEWRSLQVGADRGVNCEHMQALLTNMLQRLCEWQEDLWTDLEPAFCKYDAAFLASLDVRTAFDAIKPSVVSRILALTGVHGHVSAALLAEMQDVQGSTCFENCETEFRYSRCIRQGGLEAPVLRGRVAKQCVVESRGKMEGLRMGSCFRRGERQRKNAARYDVGGQLLAILRQQGGIGVHGE